MTTELDEPTLNADAPPEVAYGQVRGYFVRFVADTTDVGNVPDEIPLTGTVTLAPLVQVVRFPTTTPPRLAVADTITCQVLAGNLCPPDDTTPGVYIIATDQANGSPNLVQWRATFRFDGLASQPGPVTFNVPAGGVVDLALVESTDVTPPTIVVVSHEDAEAAQAAADEARYWASVAQSPQYPPGGLPGQYVTPQAGGTYGWAPQPVADGDYGIDMRRMPGADDAAKLQAAITQAATTGGVVLIPATLDLGVTGITVPQGVWFRTHGKTGSAISYRGTGVAFTFTGTSATDIRVGGGFLDPVLFKLFTAAAGAVDLVDTRDIRVDCSVMGNGNGSGTRLAAFGVRLRCTLNGAGCSWNTVAVRGEYLTDATVILDGSGKPTGPWCTRNLITGHGQSSAYGVRMVQANTNQLEFHPQNCDIGWSLNDSDTNDIYTVCENNTVDLDIDNLSSNNRVRGSIGVTGTIANIGFNTTMLATLWSMLPPQRNPTEWDGNGANYAQRPKAGQPGTTYWARWTRKDDDTLTRAYYVERGVATPRVLFDAPVQFNGPVTGIPVAADTCVVKSADTVRNNVGAAADDPHLTLPVVAGATYLVTAMVIYDSSTTADIQLGFSAPAGSALDWTADGLRGAAATGQDQIHRIRGALATMHTIGGVGTGTRVIATPTGLLTTGGNAGSLALRWAQGVAEATDTTVSARSWLSLKKVG